ncbi:FAD-dependent oxidoreductase [Streptomyces violaceusniger]|uniref:FAD-dependent oxidoreductase n=1 Tax=Streptomyces violaceusniger TaxID=68280 RepID=UPI0036BF6EF4
MTVHHRGTRVPDTVVVGAGLVGLARALDLSRAGRRVALLEASDGHGRPGPDAGTAPPMPSRGDPRQVVRAVADAPAADAELLRTAPDGTPVVERRVR